MTYIANFEAKQILSENVKQLMGGFSQEKLKKAKIKSGVSEGTIANMISLKDGNPTFSSICAFAAAYKVSVSDLLTKDMGNQSSCSSPAITSLSADTTLSPEARRLISRLAQLDSTRQSPPALYALIENALDLVHPAASGSDYAGLNDL